MAVSFGSIIQIYGIHDYQSAEYSTTHSPGYKVIEWDARPASNWKLYIADQNSNILQTVDIGALTEEDINEEKAKNYGVFASVFELPASLCPNSDSARLQIYIEAKNQTVTRYKSNTVSITLDIPKTNEFYPSLKTHETYVEGYVRGENNQDYLLVGSSKFQSSAEYIPGSGADSGYVYGQIYKGASADVSGNIENYTDAETIHISENPYIYEYKFNEPNTYAFGFIMFDSRGRWGPNAMYASDVFQVWDYARPSLTLTVQRDTSAVAPKVICKYKCIYSQLGEDGNGNELKQLHIERKDLNAQGSDWVEWERISVSTNSSGEISLAMGSPDDPSYASHEWAFRGWVDDTIMQSKYPTYAERRSNSAMSQVSQIQSEFRVFNIHKDGKGLAVGKIATEADKLDVNIPTIFRDNVTFEKGVTANGLKDAYNTDRTLKCSYIDDGAFTNPVALVGCKLGDNGPRYANISATQALSLLGLSTLEGLDIKFGQVALEYSANTGGSTNDIFISGLSDVLFAAVMPCFDTGNILLKRNDDGSIYYTSSSTGINITAIIPKLTANGTRNTTWMAIGHKK